MTEAKISALGTDFSLFGEEHIRVYRETDGEVGYDWNGVPILLVTTTGRKSGEPRTIPIIFRQVGDVYVIIASNGGSPTHPGWFLNIEADPNVEVQIKGEIFAATAREAEGEERERLWLEANAGWPKYDSYQERTSRRIPVVVIERRA